MCTITETKMTCGHRLRSIQRCQESEYCNGGERPSTASSASSTASSPERINLPDTCARCDRPAHLHKSRRSYETNHAELVMRYVDAKSDGDITEMHRLESTITRLYRNLIKKNSAITVVGGGNLDVTWPGFWDDRFWDDS